MNKRDHFGTLFQEGLGLNPTARDKWLSDLSRSTPELAEELASLLNADRIAGDVFGKNPFSSWRNAQPFQFGPYRALREIGRGTTGIVYECLRGDDVFHKHVAVKLLRNTTAGGEILRRFQVEREILANLEHPNIARVLDGGATPEKLPFVVMEYVDGVPVDQYCSNQQLDARQITNLIAQLCEAIDYVHHRQIVHCDIKPGNVLVNREGQVKLLDFSVACPTGLAALLPGGEREGKMISGHTPEFASPEQKRGEPAERRCDIFSIGRVLESSASNTRVPEDLRAILRKACHPAAVHRYPTALALRDDLIRFRDGQAVSARPLSLPILAGRLAIRHPLALIAAALIIALSAHAGYRTLSSAMIESRVASQESEIEHLLSLLEQQSRGHGPADVRPLLGKIEEAYRHAFPRATSERAGSDDRRREIVRRTISLLEVAEQSAGDDSSLRNAVARVYSVVAEFQANARGLGDAAGAVASFRRATALLASHPVRSLPIKAVGPFRVRPRDADAVPQPDSPPISFVQTEPVSALPDRTARLRWSDQHTVTLARVQTARAAIDANRGDLERRGFTPDSRHVEALARWQELMRRAQQLAASGEFEAAGECLRQVELDATGVLKSFGR